MTDTVDKATRSRIMSRVHSKNTKPELLIRSGLHKRGFRFRVNVKDLPGKPDIVLPKYRAVIFIHGCFWHGHDCKRMKLPTSNSRFWREKLDYNVRNDEKVHRNLREMGWRVAIVWECSFRGAKTKCIPVVCDQLSAWFLGNKAELLINESTP